MIDMLQYDTSRVENLRNLRLLESKIRFIGVTI